MKLFGGFIVVVLMFAFMPSMMNFSHQGLVESVDQPFNDVVTAMAVTDATVTLSQSPFYTNSVKHITVASDNDADAPSATVLVSSNKHLTVSGLAADDTRVLTVTFEIDRWDDNPIMGLIIQYLPMIVIFALIAVVGKVAWDKYQKGSE